jgi:hypothetical protein
MQNIVFSIKSSTLAFRGDTSKCVIFEENLFLPLIGR